MLKFLDITEWAQSLRMASDKETADFAGEVLELLDCEADALRYAEIIEALEKATDKTFSAAPDEQPWRWAEYVEGLLTDREEAKEKRLERARKVCASALSPVQEYDL